MFTDRPSRCITTLFAIMGVTIGSVSGCRPAEDVRSYSVPKEPKSENVAPVFRGPTHRMVAAIVPAGQKAWFFKVVGPTAAVNDAAPQVVEFFKQITFHQDEGEPSWQLPEDWSEQAGSEMRLATISIPHDGGDLEMSVTGLPYSGEAALLANVNRWRRQMRLPPLEQDQLATCTRELKSADADVTLVDLRGHWQEPGMGGPLAGRLPHAGQASGGGPSTSAGLPESGPAGHSALEGVPHMSAPDGWEPTPATGFRKAAYQIQQDGQSAEVTVMDFSANPAMADPLANVNRWRAVDLGLQPISNADLDQYLKSIKVDGQDATLVELHTPEDAPLPKSTIAAMVQRKGQVWFFKMTGDQPLVRREQENFRTFLDSVRFGGQDGDEYGDD